MLTPLEIERFANEIVGALAAENRSRGLLRIDFPRLTNDGFSSRMKAITSGRGKGAVSFPSSLKKFVAQHFSDFVFHDSRVDYHRFKKKLSADFSLILMFERIHHHGLGKSYTVHVGFEHGGNEEIPRWRIYSLFEFFDRGRLEWTYALHDDLEACLRESATLLHFVLPEFEAAWHTFLATGESKVLAMPLQSSLSFHEAAKIAYRAFRAACPQYTRINAAWLDSVRTHSLHRSPSVEKSTSTPPSGRLAPSQLWRIRFADMQTNRCLIVGVPYCGKLTFALYDDLYVNRENVHHRLRASPSCSDETLTLPLMASSPSQAADWNNELFLGEFSDSPEIVELSESSGGADFWRHHPDCAIDLHLDAEASEPPLNAEYWSVRYRAFPNSEPTYLTFHVSARAPTVLARYPQDGDKRKDH